MAISRSSVVSDFSSSVDSKGFSSVDRNPLRIKLSNFNFGLRSCLKNLSESAIEELKKNLNKSATPSVGSDSVNATANPLANPMLYPHTNPSTHPLALEDPLALAELS